MHGALRACTSLACATLPHTPNNPNPPGTIRFNERVLKQFQAFYNRPDTFSLGICNGCQLQALLGWVPATGAPGGGVGAQLPDAEQPRFVHNKSGRCVAACLFCAASLPI